MKRKFERPLVFNLTFLAFFLIFALIFYTQGFALTQDSLSDPVPIQTTSDDSEFLQSIESSTLSVDATQLDTKTSSINSVAAPIKADSRSLSPDDRSVFYQVTGVVTVALLFTAFRVLWKRWKLLGESNEQ